MFCMHCGKQLEDGSRFCIYCGKPLEEAPAAVPAEAPVEETVAAAPVVEAPAVEIPAAEPVSIPFDPQVDLYPEPPVTEAPIPEPVPLDANVYSDSAAPVAKKKGKKTGAIVAIILVLVLLIGGGVGFYLYTQHVYQENLAAYEDAALLLEKGDYDGALAAFRELDDFEDAADRAEELEELQKNYLEAQSLLDEHKFADAYTAFSDLGDYRDSENYVENEITYQEALYLMETAGDSVDIYNTAADYFLSLGDYASSVDLASECYLKAALILLEQGDFDQAMGYEELLNTADAAALQEAYGEFCADEAFLGDIVTAFVTWLDENDAYTLGAELQAAGELMDPYENAYFDDPGLAGVREDFLTALDTMYSSLESDTSVYDTALYYYGMYQLYCVADELYDSYGVFADDTELRDTFVGLSSTAYAYYVIETSLVNWWDNDVTAEQMSDGRYYAAYTNDTGYAFNLYAEIYFYDASDNLLEVSDWIEIYVAKGATVYIPTIPETISDNDWYTWYMEWDYDSVS